MHSSQCKSPAEVSNKYMLQQEAMWSSIHVQGATKERGISWVMEAGFVVAEHTAEAVNELLAPKEKAGAPEPRDDVAGAPNCVRIATSASAY